MRYLWIYMLIVPDLISWIIAIYDIVNSYKESKKPYSWLSFWKRLSDFTICCVIVHAILILLGIFIYSLCLYAGGVE